MDKFRRRKGISWIFSLARNRVLAGVFILVPVVVTVWIITGLVALMTNWASEERILRWIPFLSVIKEEFWFDIYIRLMALIFILVILFFIGELAKYTLTNKLIHFGDLIMMRLPLIKTVYKTCHQIVEAFRSPGGGMFREVVLFEYPRKGIYVIGFLTNRNKGSWEIGRQIGEELISVFLPTTPNPTSGFLLFIPRKDCVFLEMGITDAMRLVISGGAINPELNESKEEHYG